MRFSSIILSISLLTLILSCYQKQQSTPSTTIEPLDTLALAQGFQLAQASCFTCHSPDASFDNRVAPPMQAIKVHYNAEDLSFAQFHKDLSNFFKNPSADISKMPEAVKRFGVMPKLNFSDDQIKSVAYYIYYTELEKPEWFEKHYQEQKQKYDKLSLGNNALEIGKTMALKTKGVLGRNLLEAINTKGTEHALQFCSTRAIPLTDSLALAQHADIKRGTDKARNPSNALTPEEDSIFTKMKSSHANGEEVMPIIVDKDSMNIGYYPIFIDKMCLQCHGKPESEILPKTLQKIQNLYPKDKSTGYSVGDLRGIWVVKMDK